MRAMGCDRSNSTFRTQRPVNRAGRLNDSVGAAERKDVVVRSGNRKQRPWCDQPRDVIGLKPIQDAGDDVLRRVVAPSGNGVTNKPDAPARQHRANALIERGRVERRGTARRTSHDVDTIAIDPPFEILKGTVGVHPVYDRRDVAGALTE